MARGNGIRRHHRSAEVSKVVPATLCDIQRIYHCIQRITAQLASMIAADANRCSTCGMFWPFQRAGSSPSRTV